MFFKNGQTIDQIVGAVPKPQLKAKVDALLAK
jgi:thioredoxin-like negative regulator of GroEL